jgi:glycosyltransferase involved in cell wall biosynthesis
MARMEPENNIEMIVRGWMASRKTKPLVLIGNPGNSFGKYLVSTYRHEKIQFVGAIYDADTVNALRHYSSFYLHGHSVGGTNPSLLEAMACGCLIAAHDNPFNKAILKEQALYFSSAAEITELLNQSIAGSAIEEQKEKNLEKIKKLYNWPAIIAEYERVFLTAAK